MGPQLDHPTTFLFTDIEGSTRLWEEQPEAMRSALARHDRLLAEAIAGHRGRVFKTIGDAFCAAFGEPSDAVAAAVAGQRALSRLDGLPLRVRMALHSGEADERDDDYFGPTVNRVARLLATAHGGQVVVSGEAAARLGRLDDGLALRDLGSHRLRDLARPIQVHQLVAPELADDFPPLRSLSSLPNNLPLQLSSFIGRERELAAVLERLAEHRLVTLTGIGGAGKSRLALQAAAARLSHDADGAWLVELAPVREPGQVPHAVAATLGLVERPGRSAGELVREHLVGKRLLLILDNCEHLLDQAAAFADGVLQQCAGVRILATSREALGIAGEASYQVPSLELPADTAAPAALSQIESVQLFVERARAARAGFALSGENAAQVVQICRRLDGIPLAIELAAARVRAMSPEQIAARLDDRFRLLTGGSRTALPRQQTLQGLIDWSYDLLEEDERLLLARASVFVGGFTLEAAEAVCGTAPLEAWQVLDLLTSLVDKSLLVFDEEPASRYRLLETVRQYAREKLGAGEAAVALRSRHGEYYADWLRSLEPSFSGAGQVEVMRQITADHDNLRSALDWWTAGPTADQAAGLAVRLAWFWFVRGHWSEGVERLSRMLNMPELGPVARVQVLRRLGQLETLRGRGGEAAAAAEEALALDRLHGTPASLASTVNLLANVCFHWRQFDRALELYREGLALMTELDDPEGRAVALTGLANIALEHEQYDDAERYQREVLTIFRVLDHSLGQAAAMANLANSLAYLGRLDEARALVEQAQEINRRIGNPKGAAVNAATLGLLELSLERYDAATEHLLAALAAHRELGDRLTELSLLSDLGRTALEAGRPDEARAWFAELAPRLREETQPYVEMVLLSAAASLAPDPHLAATALGALETAVQAAHRPLNRLDHRRIEALTDQLAQELGGGALAAAQATGRAMSREQALELAASVLEG